MDQHHHHNQDHEQQQKPYKDHHHHHQQAPIIQDHNHPYSPKKQQQSKRDEWSEGAVTTLLEAYESKWTLRNRAKLKGQDWEDVARIVSSRAGNTKSVKTLTQCKNKIESMKKRYRSESAAAAADEASSSWPLYSRIDSLLRGSNSVGVCCGKDDVAVEAVAPPPRPVVLERPEERDSGGGGDHEMGKENNIDDVIPKPAYPESEKIVRIGENDSINTPVERQSTRPKAKAKRAILKQRIRRRRGDFCEIADSIRWLAEALIRSEQSRMEKMKEIEKMRVEAEAKRAQIDLKMTEIIANTQLEIARIFADVIKRPSSSGDDSSMKIGRSS